MANLYNAWMSMSDHFKGELWPYVRDEPPTMAIDFPEINNIAEETRQFFRNIHDEDAIERGFKPWNAAGRTYRVWSFYANRPEDTAIIRADWDMLAATYPQDYAILGLWQYGQQDPPIQGYEVGTGGGANPGSEWYPIPPQTLNFMADVIVDNTDPENPVYGPATDLTDTNLLFGQGKRDFSSYYA